jgi:hypothetical protein
MGIAAPRKLRRLIGLIVLGLRRLTIELIRFSLTPEEIQQKAQGINDAHERHGTHP